LKKVSTRRPWRIPGLVAAILFIGGLASNLVAGDLQASVVPYRRWVWGVFALALIITVVIAIIQAGPKAPWAIDQENQTRIPTRDNPLREKNIDIHQTASTVVNALHQLRAPVGDFVGRDQEVETLINALRHDSRACISGINGIGGIGKTELALLVAECLIENYPDAQFFINLQGTDA
jgi:hypothetical protein